MPSLPVLTGALAAFSLLVCLGAMTAAAARRGAYEPFSAIVFIVGVGAGALALCLAAVNGARIAFGV